MAAPGWKPPEDLVIKAAKAAYARFQRVASGTLRGPELWETLDADFRGWLIDAQREGIQEFMKHWP